jgi:methylamine dehydrogenase accessory protein MauD
MDSLLVYSNIGLWIVQLLIAFSLILIFRQFGTVYLRDKDAISRDGIPIGKKIPFFEAKSIKTGSLVSKDSLVNKNKPTIITFISTRCQPCNELIPQWNKAYEEYGDDVNFLLIAIGEENNIVKLVKEKEGKGEILVDNSSIASLFQTRVTPFGFIIDHNGVVKGKGVCSSISNINHLLSQLDSKYVSLNLKDSSYETQTN